MSGSDVRATTTGHGRPEADHRYVRPLCTLLFLLVAATLTAGEAAAEMSSWQAALERASVEGKPIVVFDRPLDCRDEESRHDPCEAFEELLDHPAIARRLDRVVFVTREGRSPAIEVLDPSGRPAIRWPVPSNGALFRRMLNLVDGASEHLVAAQHARLDGDEVVAGREDVLAAFSLGNEAVGRAMLKELSESSNTESRELAAVWGVRLDTRMGDARPHQELERLARLGTTARVRFEAWMLIAEMERTGGRNSKAIAAYREAVSVAPDPSLRRDIAMMKLQEAAESAQPVAGLGAPGSIVAGRRTLQPLWSEKDAASVEYRLDGRLVAPSRQRPFAAAVNFGRIPKRQEIIITAVDLKGRVIRSASVMVNDRTGAFSVEIIEPAAAELSGATDVEVSVRVPRGRTTRRVVIEWNGEQVAEGSTPPYRARIDAKRGELGILRAAARLDDGSELEDVRLFNMGVMTLESDVHLVQIPVYSTNRSLSAGDVSVKEEGATRPVDRVIAAEDAPLVVALVLDVSKSMEEWVLHLEQAALEFVESLDERDRVMVVAFDSVARVALWPTSDQARIERAIQHLPVRGLTALNDAMIMSLLQLQSTGSRRAMVVMSDGVDTTSVFSQGDVEEVARRSAVPTYVLMLNPIYEPPPSRLGGSTMQVRSSEVRSQARFRRLGKASGGDSFILRSLDELSSYWSAIAKDLRGQSLVIYRPSPSGPVWRSIEVSLKRGGSLRAPSGVYVEVDRARDEEQQ
jgi:VWFA-related protein